MSKRILLLIVFGMFLVVCSYGVSAGVNITSPVNDSNYSTSMWVNVTYPNGTGITDPVNATFYYNGTSIGNVSCGMSTTVAYGECNGTISIADVPDGIWTINATLRNSSDSLSANISAFMVTIDNTPPYIHSFSTTADYSNYTNATDTIVLNVSVSDALLGIDTVYLNITNSTGDEVNWTNTTEAGGNYSIPLNISAYADGLYTITVYANDSYVNNLNNSEAMYIRMDNTAPTVTVSRSAYTRTSLTLAISASDDTSMSSCTVDRSGATVSGLTITETGLSCSTSYDYVVTCSDEVYNNGTSATSSFSTDACAGSNSGGGGTTGLTWTHTYILNENQFKEGYSKELGANERIRLKVGNNYHNVGVLSLTATSANIEVSSDPVLLTLNVGGEAKLDLNDDGFYDIIVKLLGIANNKADVSVQEIHQEVPEGGEAVSSTGDVTPIASGGEGEEEEDEGMGLNWLWFIVIGVILVGVVAWFVLNKKKK